MKNRIFFIALLAMIVYSGNLLSMIIPDGIRNLNDRHADGWLQRQSDPSAPVKQVTVDPCSNIISLGTGGSQNLQTYLGGGTGVWFNTVLNACNYYSPGIEQVYSFTPAVTGNYSIAVTSATGSFVNYMWRTGSCSPTGWSCIANVNTPGTYGSLAWTAGTTYYILLDDITTSASEHTFFIFLNPCDAVTSIGGTGSGYQQTYNGGGTGVWFTTTDTPCGFTCPGKEKLFSFVPATTGRYSVTLTAASGGVDYMWNTTCSAIGWNCISHINSTGTYGSVLMNAGETYYILLDDNNTAVGTHVFYINLAEAAGNWEGNVDHNWNNAYNWSATCVPTPDVDVTIYSGYTNAPILPLGTGNCNNLTIGAGATLQIVAGTLTVNGTIDVSGQLGMSHDAGSLIVTGDFLWEGGSTASITAAAEIKVYGNWRFMGMANTFLADGTVNFEGTTDSYIQSNSNGCSFHNVKISKTAGSKLTLNNSTSVDVPVNGYFSIQPGATFECLSDDALILRGGFFNENHFYFHNGTLVLDGIAQYIKPNVGDFINNLTLTPSTGVSFNSTYTDVLTIKGDLTILTGTFNPQDKTIAVGGDWDNQAGIPGFNQGNSTVIFNGGNYPQNCSAEQFNILEVDKPLGGNLKIDGPNVTCASYEWTAGGIEVISGAFTANNLSDPGIFGSYTLSPGATINLHNDDGPVNLNGFLNISGGIFNVYGGIGIGISQWPFLHDGGITMSGGILDFKDVGIYVANITSGNTFTENITGGIIRTTGGVDVQSENFHPEGGTIEFYGPGYVQLHTVINGSSGRGSVYSIIINKEEPTAQASQPGTKTPAGTRIYDRPGTSLSGTVGVNYTADINGNVTILSGKLSAGISAIYVAGNWNNQVGVEGFDAGTGWVTFDGDQAADILSPETFYWLEVDKTYNNYDALEINQNVTCMDNLHILDGCVELNDPACLFVSGDIYIAPGAGLNANDAYGPEIYVGKDWWNPNPPFTTSTGFDPGFYSTVIFNGTIDQVASDSPELVFSSLKIDKPSGQFRPSDPVFANRDIIINSGEWNDKDPGYIHRVGRHFLVNTSGNLVNDVAQNTFRFEGNLNSVLRYSSNSGSFHHVVIDKTAAGLVSQIGNVNLHYSGDFTVETGTYDLNGQQLLVTGDVNVNTTGTLAVPNGSTLILTDLNNLNVNNGGLLNITGISGDMATIRANSGTARFNFNVNPGGNIAADFCQFSRISANGVFVRTGAFVNTDHAFKGCSFSEGTAGGTLLTLENDQILTVRNAIFPANTWGGNSNVRKNLNTGRAYFVEASGDFSGEAYDDDPFSLILWITALQVNPTAVPPAICQGVTSQLNANASGATTPYTYLWSPATGLSNPAIANPVANPAVTTVYTVTVTDGLGTTATGTVTVSVGTSFPVGVTIAASGNPVPTGTTVTFTATPVNGGTSPAYQWKVNAANVGTNQPTYSYVPNDGDQIWCVLTSNAPCITGNPATSDMITMYVVELNTAVSGVVTPIQTVCYDAFNTITVAGGGTTFVVQNGGSATMIAGMNILYRYGTRVVHGGYLHGYITTTNTYCGMLPPAMVAVVTGVESPPASDQGNSRFTIFPNPTAGRFTLMAKGSITPGPVQIEIFGMRGEQIRSERIYLENKLERDLSGVPGGIYFVRIGTGDSQEVHKLVLTR
ncbi:MAG: T9SS type A sorting domain-containing protein [Bacteroidales bacterium]|nr:T9SS type A sorting domain-containing protein [Bacteroidales bacterium]